MHTHIAHYLDRKKALLTRNIGFIYLWFQDGLFLFRYHYDVRIDSYGTSCGSYPQKVPYLFKVHSQSPIYRFVDDMRRLPELKFLKYFYAIG